VLKKLDKKSAIFKNFIQKSLISFEEENDPIPLFLWVADPETRFNGKDIEIDTSTLPGAE